MTSTHQASRSPFEATRRAPAISDAAKRVGLQQSRTRESTQVGAGDGTRTRDSLLGRQALYQLSYPRQSVLQVYRRS